MVRCPTCGTIADDAPWLRTIVLAVCLVILTYLTSCGPRTRVPVGPFATPEAALAVLLTDGSRVCNAVATGPETLYTAAHCVDGSIERKTQDGFTWSREWAWGATNDIIVREAHPVPDWARLTVLEPLPAWLPMRHPDRGEPVAAIVWRDGGWTPLISWNGEPGHFDSNIPIVHGDSGSPVIGLDGKVLGIVITCKRKHGYRECTGGGNWRPL